MNKTGRPPFRPTASQQRRVSVAAAAGTAHGDIADALGISRGTLLKYFEVELSSGALLKRIEIIEALYRAARRGHVAAAKAFLALRPTPAIPRPPKVGKREQAQRDAPDAHVGSEWETLLGSKRTQ